MPSLIREAALKRQLCTGSRFKLEMALQWITTSTVRFQPENVNERLCKLQHVHQDFLNWNDLGLLF